MIIVIGGPVQEHVALPQVGVEQAGRSGGVQQSLVLPEGPSHGLSAAVSFYLMEPAEIRAHFPVEGAALLLRKLRPAHGDGGDIPDDHIVPVDGPAGAVPGQHVGTGDALSFAQGADMDLRLDRVFLVAHKELPVDRAKAKHGFLPSLAVGHMVRGVEQAAVQQAGLMDMGFA